MASKTFKRVAAAVAKRQARKMRARGLNPANAAHRVAYTGQLYAESRRCA